MRRAACEPLCGQSPGWAHSLDHGGSGAWARPATVVAEPQPRLVDCRLYARGRLPLDIGSYLGYNLVVSVAGRWQRRATGGHHFAEKDAGIMTQARTVSCRSDNNSGDSAPPCPHDSSEVARRGLDHLSDPLESIFPPELTLLPDVNELYELRLAYMESLALTHDELLERGAYFAEVDGKPTKHYLLCGGEALDVRGVSSARVQRFFEANQFKTGYATHGLFPYRGKFHPQMIKGILNIMRLRPGQDTVLDPMMGSGTVLVEAALLGIKAIGIDINPFCALMSNAKLAGLVEPVEELQQYLPRATAVFEALDCREAQACGPDGGPRQATLDELVERSAGRGRGRPIPLPADGIGDILELAYLDSIAYARRTKNGAARELFPNVLGKYVKAIERAQTALERVGMRPSSAEARSGDARRLDLPDRAVQGVVFSPPYSFAIDYIKADLPQLRYLRCDVGALRQELVGLRGSGRQKVLAYFEDMSCIMREVGRVLVPGGFCTVVVGSNTRQLSRVLGKPETDLVGIDERLVTLAEEAGLDLVQRLLRQITGMRNVMRSEWILIFQRR